MIADDINDFRLRIFEQNFIKSAHIGQVPPWNFIITSSGRYRMLSEPYLLAPLFDFLFHDKIGLDSLPAGLCFDSTPLVSNNKIIK